LNKEAISLVVRRLHRFYQVDLRTAHRVPKTIRTLRYHVYQGAIGPHFAPKAKHVIYLHMVGGPPQQDMYDYKPAMDNWYDKDLPESIRNGQRLTTMTSGQKRFPIAPSKFKFKQHGESGMWVTELLPWTAKMVDEMCFVRSMHTEAINHEPAITYMQTGNQITGRPCLGSWTSYGLGSLNEDLPAFVVLVAQSTKPGTGAGHWCATLVEWLSSW
jgi:hypothetical protein